MIYKNGIPVGFALVHDITVNPDADWKISEFFVMQPYKSLGIGRQAVEWLLKQHHGLWEVSVLKDNAPALAFWKKCLRNPKAIVHKAFPNYLFFERGNLYSNDEA